MIFIRPVTPFINSIYEIYDLCADLELINVGITKYLNNNSIWINRSVGKQTQNLTEIIPEFQQLFNKLDSVVVEILQYWSITSKPKLNLHFINIDKNYSVSEPHCHANCILSGVFYVTIPEGSGLLKFYRPDSQEYQFKINSYNNPYINRTYEIKPKSNMAVIFPSYIKHGVGVSQIKEEESRISIAFDYSI